MADERETRKRYEKPVLRVIELTAEEVMGKCAQTGTGASGSRRTCSTCPYVASS